MNDPTRFSPQRFGLLLIGVGIVLALIGAGMAPWGAWTRERAANSLLSTGLVTSGTVVEVRHQPGGGRGARYSYLDEKGRRIEGWLVTRGFPAPAGADATEVDARSIPVEGSVLTVAYDAADARRHAAWNAEAPASAPNTSRAMGALALLMSGLVAALWGASLAVRARGKKTP